MEKELTIGAKPLKFATITAGVAKKCPLRDADGNNLPVMEFNERLIVNSLTAGGHENAQDIVDGFPYFADAGDDFSQALDASIEVNGLKKASAEGKEVLEPKAEAVSE